MSATAKIEFLGTAAGNSFQSAGEFYCSGGKFLAMAYGTFGGGSASIQMTHNGTNYAVMKNLVGANLTLTADGCMFFEAPAGLRMRPIITSGTSQDITWVIWKMRPN